LRHDFKADVAQDLCATRALRQVLDANHAVTSNAGS
jgi:hypothetical protein